MKRLLFGTLVFILTASAAMATHSLHFSTKPGTEPSWVLAESAGTWTLSFKPTGIEVDDNSADAVYLDLVGMPSMTLFNIVDNGSVIRAGLHPTAGLTITDDTGGSGTVMTAALANGDSITIGTTYLAYWAPRDDLNITSLTGGYSPVLDGLQTAEDDGWYIDFSFTGSSSTNLYTLLHNNVAGSSARGPMEGIIFAIPAPGAVVLGGPNGAEGLISGTIYTITWSSTGPISDVIIEYSIDNGANWTLINTVPNTGSYDWLVPTIDSNQCLVRISDSSDQGVSDTSDGVFTIETLKWPLQGILNERTILLGFGADWAWGECPPGVVKKHVGIDVSATVGEDIYAPEAGIVKAKVDDPEWKYCVTIEHSGFTTVCWHVDPLVNVGDNVTRGQIIATIADLGANTHLHFGVRGSTYSNISNRGALPQNDCGGDPAFPEYFVDPMTLEYETTQPGARVQGIDVSSWQGENIDWPSVHAAGYEFAFVRASLGDENPPLLIDDNFYTNMINARAAGMLVGAYHFAYPELTVSAESEARHFLNVAREYLTEGYLRPVLDIETGASLDKTALSNWVHEWMNTVKNETGIKPIVYTHKDYAENYLDATINQYDLWIAHWTYDPSSKPGTGIWDDWAFWQYSDQGSVPGISGPVDLDLFNGDMSRLNTFMIPLEADISGDGKVDFTDLEITQFNWLEENCSYPNWCDAADLNYSGRVDLADFAIFAEHWLEGSK